LSLLFNKADNWLAKELPFVVYRKPNDNEVCGFFQPNDTVFKEKNFFKSGFIFSPFDSDKSNIFFSEEESEFIKEEIANLDFKIRSIEFDEVDDSQQHKELVRKGIDFIRSKSIKKIVLSRKEIHTLSSINIIESFKNLLSLYSNAFVYLWYHPKIGLWLGATPETLISLKNNNFTTIALASTQSYKGSLDVVWGQKEVDEHKYVIDFISNNLEKLLQENVISNFSVSKTKTVKVADLLHLKAIISGSINSVNLKKIVDSLHPTPAVCGLPKDLAKEFILENENYDRNFYTGYLGEININHSSNLFVNLRCAEINNNDLLIYVGGGITAQSSLEKEWIETVNKTVTIKKAII